MMNFAHGHAVDNGWRPVRMGIGNDMSGIQKNLMPQVTDCAPRSIRVDNRRPKKPLVETGAGNPRPVSFKGIQLHRRLSISVAFEERPLGVDVHDKLLFTDFLINQKDREYRLIQPGRNSEEPN